MSAPLRCGHGQGDALMISLSWPTHGTEFGNPWHYNAAAFLALVQANPGFWCRDFALKYLRINLDTREGGSFTLADRDGERIHADRVLCAIAKHRRL